MLFISSTLSIFGSLDARMKDSWLKNRGEISLLGLVYHRAVVGHRLGEC